MLVVTVDGKQKWAHLLKKVKNPYYNPIINGRRGIQYVPLILVEMGGAPTPEKQALANKALVEWMVSVKKKNADKLDDTKVCPFYQPSTQNLQLRTFMSVLKDNYNFNYTLSDFKKIDGSLAGALAKFYAQRAEKYVSFFLIFI